MHINYFPFIQNQSGFWGSQAFLEAAYLRASASTVVDFNHFAWPSANAILILLEEQRTL